MSRRRRALAFLVMACITAAGAAALADRYRASAVHRYGPLRPVVVVKSRVAAGHRFGPGEIFSTLAVRRVPSQFTPPGALVAREEAVGLIARTSMPAGSYLLGSQLGVARERDAARSRLGGGRRPVEIAVSGAQTMLAAGKGATGPRVDVVITSEPLGPGPGRTYIAAAQVPLLGLSPGPEGPGPGSSAIATLGLTKRQALRLIAAESFAREVTLLPGG